MDEIVLTYVYEEPVESKGKTLHRFSEQDGRAGDWRLPDDLLRQIPGVASSGTPPRRLRARFAPIDEGAGV